MYGFLKYHKSNSINVARVPLFRKYYLLSILRYDFKEIGADVDEVSDLVSTLRLSPTPKFTLVFLSLVAAMPPMTNAGVHQMINRAICEFTHF